MILVSYCSTRVGMTKHVAVRIQTTVSSVFCSVMLNMFSHHAIVRGSVVDNAQLLLYCFGNEMVVDCAGRPTPA